MAVIVSRRPARKSVVQQAYELMAAEERKQKRAKKETEPAAPVKKQPTRKGSAK